MRHTHKPAPQKEAIASKRPNDSFVIPLRLAQHIKDLKNSISTKQMLIDLLHEKIERLENKEILKHSSARIIQFTTLKNDSTYAK